MGPCQGGFCTFRASGLIAERVARGAGGWGGVGPVVAAADGGAASGAAVASGAAGLRGAAAIEGPDGPIVDYLRERFNGTRPIAAGRQLQELWMVLGIYHGALGVDSLVDAGRGVGAGLAPPGPAEARDAER
jgi:hypothetical protein